MRCNASPKHITNYYLFIALLHDTALTSHAGASNLLLCLRLRFKAASLSSPEDGLLVIVSDLLSYNHVTTWRATLQSPICAQAALASCSGSETCDGSAIDDDGMAGLPDVEETLNVFLR
jgi:hypothetical protein